MRNFKCRSLAALLALAGCAAGPTIAVDQDPSVNVSDYETFGFFDRQDADGSQYSTILTEHLKRATRAELERLGYIYDEARPALRVNFILNVQERQELRTSPSGLGFVGPRGYGAWGGYDLETVTYKAGTLRIDLVDAARNALVWQGRAEGTVGRDALENPSVAIGRTVVGIFASFPSAQAR